jgi:hypothetical protein
LCVILVPDDERLSTLLNSVPGELPLMPDSGSAASEWDRLAREVEDDYLSRALAELVEHGHPTYGYMLGESPARLLVEADRSAGHKLGYVMVAGVFECRVLRAVLTWLRAVHRDGEVDARLRRAARKVAARKEFRGHFTWTGHSEPAPKS